MKEQTKQRLTAFARSIGILPTLDALRFCATAAKSATDNRRFRRSHPDFSPPPLWWMHDMYRHTSYELYWRTGKETAARLVAIISAHVDNDAPRIADWGCGLARVLRHLPDRFVRTGFDYNPAAIRWDATNIPDANFKTNNLAPPLDAEDASFDALYALSVFTHLSEEQHENWIAEIRRVLAPGGVFLGAFHMRPTAGLLLPHEQAAFDRGDLVVRGGVKEGSRTFTAHHPERYLRARLLKDFDILDEPIDFFGQTLFVARKN